MKRMSDVAEKVTGTFYLCKAPFGPFRQKVPVTFSTAQVPIRFHSDFNTKKILRYAQDDIIYPSAFILQSSFFSLYFSVVRIAVVREKLLGIIFIKVRAEKSVIKRPHSIIIGVTKKE
jgi:hypothetical protein